ncbi:hypothetical protein H5392_13900 [Tessaracoccus sp. MC1865]|uniref:hypothetical protein n=1 Tax=Tessaracoccus sp. MC1865 TaxID=2760310 RepID=UPI001601FD9A|nr:hypothetical protein [Tessaracoccus sp. MC1865]MBB1484951.1 hypothetical protein [Tessaracoccus sp. MC1865]QTO38618.1 hypothetical protein J7D54_05950 [Tessaracoccus sp. MC1865]
MAARLLAGVQRYLDRILVAVGVVLLFWIWHLGHLEWGTQRYVPTWMDDRILLFVAPPLILAAFGLVRAALAGAFAYPLVVVVGELLGGAAWDLQVMFLGEEHEPLHAGWWIAVALYVWVVLGAAWGDARARRWARIEAVETTPAQP